MLWCMATTYNKVLAVLCHDHWHHTDTWQSSPHTHHTPHTSNTNTITSKSLGGPVPQHMSDVSRYITLTRLSPKSWNRPWLTMIRAILSPGWFDETMDWSWALGQALAVYYCQFSIVLTNWGNTLICEDCFLITFTFSSIINTIFCSVMRRLWVPGAEVSPQPLYPTQVTVQSAVQSISNSSV